MNMNEVHKVFKVLKGRKVLLTFGFINFITFNCFAQHKQFDTIEYRVVEQANANIANGAKINSNPAIADTVKPSRKVDYNTIGTQFSTSYIPESLRPVQLKGEPLENQEHAYVAAGGGNNNAAYIEGFYNSIRSRDWDYGVHVNHFSSAYIIQNNENPAFSHNDVNLYGTSYMTDHTLTANLDYDEHVVHDYGYAPANIPGITFNNSNDASIRTRYNLFDAGLQYVSHYKDSNKIHHDIKVSYYNYSSLSNLPSQISSTFTNGDTIPYTYKLINAQQDRTIENNVDINAHLFSYIEKQRIDVKALVQYYNEANQLGSNHAWNLGINPYFSGEGRTWDAHLGLKAYLDAVNGGTNIFPDLKVDYHIANNAAIAYAGMDGDKQYNSYKSLSTTNPFIQDTVNNQYTRTMYHLFIGLTGSITNNVTYDVNASESQTKNMALFVTDTLEELRNRFTVVYDNVKTTNIHADISYQMKESIRFILGGDYYNYTPTNQVAVWYHPTLKINLLGEYAVTPQLTLKTEIFVVNSQYAPLDVDGVIATKKLPGYPDLNLGAEYKYSKLIGVFLHLNNLANAAYQQWDNYPTERFNVLVGVKITF